MGATWAPARWERGEHGWQYRPGNWVRARNDHDDNDQGHGRGHAYGHDKDHGHDRD
jgi:hypothetical protein